MGSKGEQEWDGSQLVNLRIEEFTKRIRGGGGEFQAGEIPFTWI